MEECPIAISVEYKGKLSRLTTFFRYAMAIPHYICLWGIGIAMQIVVFTSWFQVAPCAQEHLVFKNAFF